MQKLFLLAFMLTGIFAFGANSNGNLSELGKAESINKANYATFVKVHVEGTLTVAGCEVTYDIDMEVTLFSVEITDGTVVMGEGCDNPGTYEFKGNGEVENGYITKLDTFSEQEFISSQEFSEALRSDLNKRL